MTSIKSISFANFKGFSGSVELDKLTCIVGPNETGKSTRLYALPLAIHGIAPQQPYLGRRPDQIYKLVSGQTGSVSFATDTGFGVKREFVGDAKRVKVTQKLSVSSMDAKANLDAAQAEIYHQVGNAVWMFHVGEFASLAAQRRREFVLDMCHDAGGLDEERIVQQLTLETISAPLGASTVKALVQMDTGKTIVECALGELNLCIGKLMGQLQEGWRTAWQETVKPNLVRHVSEEGDLTTKVAAMVATANADKNLANKTAKEMRAAGAVLTQRKNELAVVAKRVDELEEERDDWVTKQDDLKKRAAQIDALDLAIASAQSREARRTKTIYGLKAKAEEANTAAEQTPDLEAEAADLRRQADEVKAAVMALPEAHTDAVDAARQKSGALKGSVDLIEGQLNELATERTGANQQLTTLQSDAWGQANDLLEQVDPEPLDETSRQHFTEALGLVSMHVADDRSERIEAIRDQLDRIQQKIGLLTDQHRHRQNEAEEAACELSQATADLEAQQQARQSALEVNEERQNTARVIQKQADEIDRQIAEIGKAQEAAAEAIQKTQAAVTEATREEQQSRQTMAALGSLPEIQQQLTAAEQAIAQLDSQIRTKKDYAVLDHQLAECLANAEQQEMTYAVAKAAEAAAKNLRKVLVGQQVKPLTGHMDTFLETAYPGHRVYCDLETPRGRETFDLGFEIEQEDGTIQRVSWDAFSGWQNAVFGTALIYGFCALKDVPLKVLTIELDGVDLDNRIRLMNGLAAVSDNLSNVLVASCIPFPDQDGIDERWEFVETGT